MDYPALSGLATGGSAISSYVILWDAGLAGTFSPVLGDVTPNLLTSVSLTSGITSGEVYQFKFLGRNAHGDGAESGVMSVLAATVPSPMNPPAVSTVSQYSPLQYRLTVIAPYPGGAGLSIDAYEILLRSHDGTVYAAVAECDGSQGAFLAALYCDIDLASLQAAPFYLELGDLVSGKVRARNSLGESPYSADSSEGGTIV